MLHVVIFVKFVAVLSISIIRLWLTSISMKLYFKIWQLKAIQMENSMMLLHISLFYRRIIEMHKGLRYMSLWETTPYCEERLLMSLLWSGRKGRGGPAKCFNIASFYIDHWRQDGWETPAKPAKLLGNFTSNVKHLPFQRLNIFQRKLISPASGASLAIKPGSKMLTLGLVRDP